MGKVPILAGIRGAEVVYQYIQMTGLVDYILYHGRESFRAGGVTIDRLHLKSLFAQGTADRFSALHITGGKKHLRPFCGAGLHTGQPDTAGGCGDQYDFLL